MIYTNYELQAKLHCLQLVGQNPFGELEWIGKDSDWKRLANEEEVILRNHYDNKTA